MMRYKPVSITYCHPTAAAAAAAAGINPLPSVLPSARLKLWYSCRDAQYDVIRSFNTADRRRNIFKAVVRTWI